MGRVYGFMIYERGVDVSEGDIYEKWLWIDTQHAAGFLLLGLLA